MKIVWAGVIGFLLLMMLSYLRLMPVFEVTSKSSLNDADPETVYWVLRTIWPGILGFIGLVATVLWRFVTQTSGQEQVDRSDQSKSPAP